MAQEQTRKIPYTHLTLAQEAAVLKALGYESRQDAEKDNHDLLRTWNVYMAQQYRKSPLQNENCVHSVNKS